MALVLALFAWQPGTLTLALLAYRTILALNHLWGIHLLRPWHVCVEAWRPWLKHHPRCSILLRYVLPMLWALAHSIGPMLQARAHSMPRAHAMGQGPIAAMGPWPMLQARAMAWPRPQAGSQERKWVMADWAVGIGHRVLGILTF